MCSRDAPAFPIFKRIFQAPRSSRRQKASPLSLLLSKQALMALPLVHFSGHLAGAVRAPNPRLPLAANLRTATVRCAASNPAKATGEKGARGIMRPRPVSPVMQEVLGVSEISRAQALKEIWAYIKEHNLQDPDNKKIIVCDEKLKKLFGGKDRVGFLEISGLINPHFVK